MSLRAVGHTCVRRARDRAAVPSRQEGFRRLTQTALSCCSGTTEVGQLHHEQHKLLGATQLLKNCKVPKGPQGLCVHERGIASENLQRGEGRG